MLETPSMQQYASRDNLLAADNQQGRLEREPSTTICTASIKRRNSNRQKAQQAHIAEEPGYFYDPASKNWKRKINGDLVWCNFCRQWKPRDCFSTMKGKPNTYCKACCRIRKAMWRYSIDRETAIKLYEINLCECCGLPFEKQTHKHIHHTEDGVIGVVCLYCNHTLRNESPEHLHRLECCVKFIKNRVKIESELCSDAKSETEMISPTQQSE